MTVKRLSDTVAPALRPFLPKDTPMLARIYRASIEQLAAEDYSHSQIEAWVSLADDEAAFEEERRLFYVALTRAKDELYLTYPMLNPKSYTGDILCRPSRFLDDFPKEMVETWNVGNEWAADDDPF